MRRLGQVCGWLWLTFLAVVLFASIRSSSELVLHTREYAYGCDSFGYMSMETENRILVTLLYFGYLQRDPRAGIQSRLERFESEGSTRALTAGLPRERRISRALRSVIPNGPVS